MNRKANLLIVAALTAAPFLSAGAQTTNSPPPQSSTAQPPQVPACPRGTHWEEAGYVGHGKYRPARCARDDGRE
ncbi:MAG TPA: hypothetical protein VM782_01460 [Stellaceae bacterium]|nr:hypothetical protein [Stellaceae bacterium]